MFHILDVDHDLKLSSLVLISVCLHNMILQKTSQSDAVFIPVWQQSDDMTET